MSKEPLELCAWCEKSHISRYNFNQRCCKARYYSRLPKPQRDKLYQHVQKKRGTEAANALIADVNQYREIMHTRLLQEHPPCLA